MNEKNRNEKIIISRETDYCFGISTVFGFIFIIIGLILIFSELLNKHFKSIELIIGCSLISCGILYFIIVGLCHYNFVFIVE